MSKQLPMRAVAVLGLVVLALSTAWGFAGVEGELRLRAHGKALNDADLALDAATASRSHFGEALRVVAFNETLATADSDRVENLAISRATEELAEFRLRVDAVLARDASQSLAATSGMYADVGNAFIAALLEGDVDNADAVFTDQLEPVYTELASELAAIRASRLTSFTDGSGMAQAISVATRILLAAAVPLLAIAGLVDAMRRRHKQQQLELELGAQRDLGRVKDEFIANVSHELRTPLAIVGGFASVLEEDTSLPDHVSEAVSYISKESDELARMVDDLLTAARADAGALSMQPEQVPVRDATEAVVSVVNDRDGPTSVRLETAYVRADAFRLRQVIRNLLSNARKHGGPEISVTGFVEGETYVLTVADNGAGVSADIEDDIFDRFVSESSGSQWLGSVGLGLAIAKSLVDRMDGSLTYERVDDWTHFVVRLPLWTAARGYEAADAGLYEAVESS
jgi:signal transduction histidine kinase